MCRPPLTATARLLRTAGGALSLVVKTWGALLSTAVGGLIGPPIQAVLSAARTVRELLAPIWKVQGSQSCSTCLHYLPFVSERLELIASSWRACSILTCHCSLQGRFVTLFLPHMLCQEVPEQYLALAGG